jgi:uncharacterized protein (UPF0335 family)
MSDEAKIGHNSDAHARLRSIVDRIERLDEERKALVADIMAVHSESKFLGLDVTVLPWLILLYKLEVSEDESREMLLDAYRRVVGLET